MRGQITHYFKGFHGVSALRTKLVQAESIAQVEDLLHYESRRPPVPSDTSAEAA
jgi:hypothetical protein